MLDGGDELGPGEVGAWVAFGFGELAVAEEVVAVWGDLVFLAGVGGPGGYGLELGAVGGEGVVDVVCVAFDFDGEHAGVVGDVVVLPPGGSGELEVWSFDALCPGEVGVGDELVEVAVGVGVVAGGGVGLGVLEPARGDFVVVGGFFGGVEADGEVSSGAPE